MIGLVLVVEGVPTFALWNVAPLAIVLGLAILPSVRERLSRTVTLLGIRLFFGRAL